MNQKKTGFTLLELLVVVGILAALVALALPFYQDYVNQSKLIAAEADLQTFQKALALYDQRESTMFNDTDLLGLIGTYLQDYRVFDGQENPLDPWGNAYIIAPSPGVILSMGPNGENDSTATIATRQASGDDLIVTWKPDFFVSTARRISDRTIELNFTRRVQSLSAADVTASMAAGGTSTGNTLQKISDTVFRINYSADLATTGNVSVADTVAAQDGRALSASLKPDDSAANTITF